MQNQNWATDAQKSEYSWVYYYLLAGVALIIAVMTILPKVSNG
jgi:hypothetical protein